MADSNPNLQLQTTECNKTQDMTEITVLHEDEPEKEAPVIPDTSTPEEDKALRAKSMQAFGQFSTFGLYLLLAVVVGYAIGHWLDSVFDCKPVLTIFWVCCGVASSIKELVRTIKLASKAGETK